MRKKATNLGSHTHRRLRERACLEGFLQYWFILLTTIWFILICTLFNFIHAFICLLLDLGGVFNMESVDFFLDFKSLLNLGLFNQDL